MNKKGELSYELLNKALIKAARSNPYVADLVARNVPEQEISGMPSSSCSMQ